MTDRHDDHDDHGAGLDLVVCPECALPAEVLDRFALGALEHVRIQCLARHWFLMPVALLLPTTGALAARTGTVR